VEYRRLGETGLHVSALGFGGAPIGLQGYLSGEDRDDEGFQARAEQALRRAVELGVNYFDTAPAYGDGRSERFFGRALEPVRDRVVIGTKYFFQPGKSADGYTEGLRASMDRLRTDRVDVLQLHGGHYTDELADALLADGAVDWACEMKARGLCRFTGITCENPSGGLERLLRTGRFDVLQVAYNLIYQAACDYQREPRGVIPLAKSLGLGVATMRSTTSGFLQKLLRREFPDIDVGRLTRLAINFVLSTPEVDCCLVGMTRSEEVEANVALADDHAARLDVSELHRRYV
jgi:hypothetical protein